VPELIAHMTQSGLSFAPSNPGHEAAYYSLHDAFVNYINTAQASSGFQIQLRPPLPPTAAASPGSR
jgi:hypothetical protein